MKFIHIADVHLGAVPDSGMSWGTIREKEIWNGLQNIITVCNDEKAELLLIAGDLFHRQPLMRELKEVNYLLSKLKTAQVVLMAGNHDYMGARSYYQDFEWDERVHMFTQDSMETMEFPKINVEVSGFSYHTRDITTPSYDFVKPVQNDRIHILLAHGGDEKNIPINKKKLQEAGFDYIALGHIHKPEIISEKMAYPGSIEPLDKNETGERGYILGEISTEGESNRTSPYHTRIRFIPSSLRQYKRVNLIIDQTMTNGALLDQAREAILANGKQHIYQFNIQGIKDVAIHFDKEALKVLGNVLEVVDQSIPDYDFDVLYRENSDNMIGLFIQRIREKAEQDEVAQKALYYGIEALIGTDMSA